MRLNQFAVVALCTVSAVASSSCRRRDLCTLTKPDFAYAEERPTRKVHSGHVTMANISPTSPTSNATEVEAEALHTAIVQLYESWCATDVDSYLSWLAPTITRLPESLGRLQQGRAEVRAGLPSEWLAYERTKGGDIGVKLDLRNAHVQVVGDVATVVVEISVTSTKKVRWKYDDYWLAVLIFAKRTDTDGKKLEYELVHYSEANDLDEPGSSKRERGFPFGFALPVSNLDRAIKFYTPIFGPPDSVSKQHAIFTLAGTQVLLDASKLDGFAENRPKLPNGYVFFQVDSLDKKLNTLEKKGLELEADKDAAGFALLQAPNPPKASGFREAILQDPSGNVFVLREHRRDETGPAPQPPEMIGTTNPPTLNVSPVIRLTRSLLSIDDEKLKATFAGNITWFDSTLSKMGAAPVASKDVLKRIHSDTGELDRGLTGLSAKVSVRNVQSRSIGTQTLFTYHRTWTSLGSTPLVQTAWVTQWVDSAGLTKGLFAVRAREAKGMSLAFDYSAYPATQLNKLKAFYKGVMDLGEPYTDELWFGFWGTRSVFGIYESNPRTDGTPVAHHTNAYPSFWVSSAEDTLAYLKTQGVAFPVIGAINKRAGLDRQPGYDQVVSTDSEGNVVLFTAYAGK